MFQNYVGTQNVLQATGDSLIGEAGKATRVFAMHIISGTAAVVALRNGQAVGGTIYLQETGTANTGKTFTYGEFGMLFPAGCFLDLDANTTSALVAYSQEV
jgi:hypothetical protein